MGKTVIYTCIVGNYDELRQPQVLDERFEYLCFVRKGAKITEKMGAWTVRELDFAGLDMVSAAAIGQGHKFHNMPRPDQFDGSPTETDIRIVRMGPDNQKSFCLSHFYDSPYL